jgi:hypothetical protein
VAFTPWKPPTPLRHCHEDRLAFELDGPTHRQELAADWSPRHTDRTDEALDAVKP